VAVKHRRETLVMIEILEKTTKLNQEIQNQKLRLLARVDFDTKIKIFKEQKQLFHKLKGAYSDVDNAVLTLSSLILAIDEITENMDGTKLNTIKLRVKNTKSKAKRQKLINYWSIVKTLKYQESMSFRQISEYFAKYHKLEVSYSTIYQLWNELENKTQTKEK